MKRLLVPCLLLGGCLLERPTLPPVRLVDPRPVAPVAVVPSPDAVPVRLPATTARGHLDTSVLVRRGDGSLGRLDDLRWSDPPARALDGAWRAAVAGEGRLRQVEALGAAAAALELTVCELDAAKRSLRMEAVLTVVGPGGRVAVRPVASTAVAADGSPGALAEAAGRAMAGLAGGAVAITVEQSTGSRP
jgi:hypothetical protein